MADTLAANMAAAEIERERLRRGIAADDGRVDLERECFPAPILHADVSNLGTGAEPEVINPAGEAFGIEVRGSETIDDGGLRSFIRDDQSVREARSA